MTIPAQPLPSAGGSYIRQPDGSLVPADQVEDAPVAAQSPVETDPPLTSMRGKAPSTKG